MTKVRIFLSYYTKVFYIFLCVACSPSKTIKGVLPQLVAPISTPSTPKIFSVDTSKTKAFGNFSFSITLDNVEIGNTIEVYSDQFCTQTINFDGSNIVSAATIQISLVNLDKSSLPTFYVKQVSKDGFSSSCSSGTDASFVYPTWNSIRIMQAPSKGDFNVMAARDVFLLMDTEFFSWQTAHDGLAWQTTEFGYASHCMAKELLYLNNIYWCVYSVYPWNKIYINSSTNLSQWNQTIVEGNSFGDNFGVQYLSASGLYIIGSNSFSLTSSSGTAWIYHSRAEILPYTSNKLTVTDGSNLIQLYGSSNLQKTSDGINWTDTPTNILSSFTPKKLLQTTEGTLYVFGSSGKIMSATDGTNWSDISSGTYLGSWNDAVFGNGKYVVVGDNGEIKISTTGGSWQTVISNPSLGNITSVAYRAGVFVAAGNDGLILRSMDGINWGSPIAPMPGTTNELSSAAFGNDKFVIATGRYELLVFGNSTANDFQYVNTSNIGKIKNVSFAGGYFWGHNDIDYSAYRSLNGIDWIPVTPPTSCSYCAFKAVAFGNNKYVAIDPDVYTSSDGANWNMPVELSSGTLYRWPSDIIFSKDSFFIAGWEWDGSGSTDRGFVAVSTDGSNWTFSNIQPTNLSPLYKIASSGTGTMVSISVVGEIVRSIDFGSNWSQVAAPDVLAAGDIFKLKYINDQYLILATSYSTFVTRVFYSKDGLNWFEETNLGNNYIQDYAHNADSNRYISVGWPSKISSFQFNEIHHMDPPNFKLFDPYSLSNYFTNQTNIGTNLTNRDSQATQYCIKEKSAGVWDLPPLIADPCFTSFDNPLNSVMLGGSGARDFYVYATDGTIVSTATHARIYYSNTSLTQLSGVHISRSDMGPNGPSIVATNGSLIWLSIDDNAQIEKWCISETTNSPLAGSDTCIGGAGLDNGWFTRYESPTQYPQFVISIGLVDMTRVFYIRGADYYNNVTQLVSVIPITRDTIPPPAPEIVARDLSSGSIGTTDQSMILITAGSVTQATDWCLIAQSGSIAPLTPYYFSNCWTPIATTATLDLTAGTGPYGIWAFTKDAAENISIGTGFSSIIYAP